MVKINKIVQGAFRDLDLNECRILFMRHELHKNNICDPEAMDRLVKQGEALKAAGITEIAEGLSSPAERAIIAVIMTRIGIGSAGYTHTDDRLTDMKAEDPQLVARLKKGAEGAGISVEEYIFELCKNDDEFLTMMSRRAKEGNDALVDLAKRNRGKTAIAASHGGSRIEASVNAFLFKGSKMEICNPLILMKEGQIVELIINTETGDLVEEHYFEPPR